MSATARAAGNPSGDRPGRRNPPPLRKDPLPEARRGPVPGRPRPEARRESASGSGTGSLRGTFYERWGKGPFSVE